MATEGQSNELTAALIEAYETLSGQQNNLEFKSKPFVGTLVYGDIQGVRKQLGYAIENLKTLLDY